MLNFFRRPQHRDSYKAMSTKLMRESSSTDVATDDNQSQAESLESTSLLRHTDLLIVRGRITYLSFALAALTLALLSVMSALLVVAYRHLPGSSTIHQCNALQVSNSAGKVQYPGISTAVPSVTHHNHPNSDDFTVPKTCPKDPEAAAAAGCLFDIIGIAWKFRACHDAALSTQFLSERTWAWSHVPNASAPISEAEMKTGMVRSGWTTWEYHRIHCLYMWLKLRRDLQLGRPRDDAVMNFQHTLHCMGELLKEGQDEEEWSTDWNVTYPLCGGEKVDAYAVGEFKVPRPNEGHHHHDV
jgi:hypothetical protein